MLSTPRSHLPWYAKARLSQGTRWPKIRLGNLGRLGSHLSAKSATRIRLKREALGAVSVANVAAIVGDISPSEELSRALHEILQGLQAALSGILGSVLVDESGLPLAWDLKGGADPTLIATAGAMISRTGERSTEILDFGNLRNAILTSDKGTLGVFRVSARTSLVVLLQPSTNNVLATVEVNKALERLRQVVSPGF